MKTCFWKIPPAAIGLLLGTALIVGCGQPVREDRTITWSDEGEAVGFQHGADGVYVANKSGEGLLKIFQPDEAVLATSTPLWCPEGRRTDPAGRIHWETPIAYTCWIREEGGAEPQPLFEAHCSHVGYVAANLAVRWHPDGGSILFVDQVDGTGGHAVFAYELSSGQQRRVFPHTSDAVVFDWSPDGTQLACVTGSSRATGTELSSAEGIWIGSADSQSWWHAKEPRQLAAGAMSSLLERLRATLPDWSPDGERFVFATSQPVDRGGEPTIMHELYMATPASRTVEMIHESDEALWDVHWTPDGSQIGFISGRPAGSLHLLLPGNAAIPIVTHRPVRGFAGWDATGGRVAYVVPDAVPLSDPDTWAFLLMPNPMPRDAVMIADQASPETPREIMSGMRVTFPTWSPRDERLSLWVTFSPTHGSLYSRFFGWGLHPGDPAATLDATTGEISWMAVNPREMAQVGHYYSLQRDYEPACHWYQQARKEREAAGPPPESSPAANVINGDDAAFFEYYCLTKLGRTAEAEARLAEFEAAFSVAAPADDQPEDETGNRQSDAVAPEPVVRDTFFATASEDPRTAARLTRDFYMAEVFLSLDAVGDAERLFQDRLQKASTDDDRFSAALVLSQLLLLDKRHEEYLELAISTILPQVKDLPPPHERAGSPTDDMLLRNPLIGAGFIALAPMFSTEFLSGIPNDRLQRFAARGETLREQAQGDFARIEVNLFLRAVYRVLQDDAAVDRVAERISQNPLGPDVDNDEVVEFFKLLRDLRGPLSQRSI